MNDVPREATTAQRFDATIKQALDEFGPDTPERYEFLGFALMTLARAQWRRADRIRQAQRERERRQERRAARERASGTSET